MLNPVHLHTLGVVLRTGSFADAARQLGYTGSAVSQQMSALERVLRTPLFEREAHSVRPTPTAELLAARSAGVLADLRALDRDVEGVVTGRIGRVRIGSFPTASRRLVPAWLAEHHRDRPGVEVVLDEDEPTGLLERLGAGELDVALVYRYDLVPRPWPRGLTRVPLFTEELVLLLPEGHELAAAHRIDMTDLASRTQVSTRPGTDMATCLERCCAAAGFEPDVAYRSNDYGVVLGFVRAGLGVALVPVLGVDAAGGSGGLDGVVVRRVDDLSARRHYFAVHRAAGHSPAVAGVVDDLARAAATIASAAAASCSPTPTEV